MLDLFFLALSVAAVSGPIDVVAPKDKPSPKTIVTSNCKRIGNVEVCDINKDVPHRRLTVNYYSSDEDLMSKGLAVTGWLSVNGVQSSFPLQPLIKDGKNVGMTFTVNEPRNEQVCYQATEADTSAYTPPNVPRCPVTREFPLLKRKATEGVVGWFYEIAPAVERDMFVKKVLDVKVGFFNTDEAWDAKSKADDKKYEFQF